MGQRSVRIENRRTGDAGAWGRRIALGIGSTVAGATTAYLLDPISGARRRAMLRDRAGALMRDGRERLAEVSRQAADALGGNLRGLLPALGEAASPNDATLAAKVETILFRDRTLPRGRINVNVEQGIAVLRGEADTLAQAAEIARRVGRIGGIGRVENLLHLPGTPPLEEPPRGDPLKTLEDVEHSPEAAGGPLPR
jgi:hypothetical protein